ncbi:MAG: protein translocase subunit SecD [Dehalococcoidia bacterium]|nr:protein translocase subunit SecD [Dehalococcoidia bacterium]
MRRIGWPRIILILLVVVVSGAAVAFQSFDLRFLGLRLQRGSDAILGMRLGLDLQGGVHLLYQARGKKEMAITFQDPVKVEDVRTVMGGLGKSDAVVQSTGERTLTLRVNTLKPEQKDERGNVTQPAEQETIRKALEEKVGKISSLQTSDIPAVVTPDQIEGVLNIITRRINPVGITEPVIQLMDNNRILVQLPGVKDVEEVKHLIGQTARLEFKERTCLANGRTVLPNGEEGDLCDLLENHLDKEVNLTGEDLTRAYPGTDPQTGKPVINVTFTSRGAGIFGDMSTRLAGTPHRFAVFLDEEEIMAPVFREPILGGSAVVSGSFTAERVRTISIQLESGRLPIPIEVVQESSVDATLGAESLRKSLIAGVAGLGLVLLFIVMYYKAPGLVAAMALIIYTVVLLAIFKLVPITLTLAGVAAFILSIGMAVDANVLIFERMKEELRLGRTLASAIEIGFNRAWTSIRDSNVSTLITCAILFWFGQRLGASLVAGFASTLAIGVVVSMFSAITISKTILNLFSISPLGSRRSWFTPEPLPAALRTASTGVARGKE